jgi:glycosyltransferase involved in cell wall biosynthesis
VNIGFDAKRLFNNFTGLGNFSRFVVNALSTYHPENHYYLYSPSVKSHPDVDAILSNDNVKIITPRGAYSFLKSAWRTVGIGHEPSARNLHIFHGLSQELPMTLSSQVRKVVTVHDLIFMRWPKFYNPVDVKIYTTKVRSACKNADMILAISRQTADDVINFLNADPKKVGVLYQGCHPNFKRKFTTDELESIATKYKLPQRYILNVGTIEERKNVLILVKALALLPKEIRIPLVIVGRGTDYAEKVVAFAKEAGISDWLIMLHTVAFEDLPGVYQGAKVFVYPSLFEGFGIPIVEALESEVPVIGATGSCLEEAGGPGSIYINPASEEELAYHLKNVLRDDELRKQMTVSGKRFASKFQPEVISQELMEVYNSVLG